MTLADVIKVYGEDYGNVYKMGSKEVLLKMEDCANSIGFRGRDEGTAIYSMFGVDKSILRFIDNWCKLLKNRLGDGDERYQDSAQRCKLYCIVTPEKGSSNIVNFANLLHHTVVQSLSSAWFKYLDLCALDKNLPEELMYLKNVRGAMVETFGEQWYEVSFI